VFHAYATNFIVIPISLGGNDYQRLFVRLPSGDAFFNPANECFVHLDFPSQ